MQYSLCGTCWAVSQCFSTITSCKTPISQGHWWHSSLASWDTLLFCVIRALQDIVWLMWVLQERRGRHFLGSRQLWVSFSQAYLRRSECRRSISLPGNATRTTLPLELFLPHRLHSDFSSFPYPQQNMARMSMQCSLAMCWELAMQM